MIQMLAGPDQTGLGVRPVDEKLGLPRGRVLRRSSSHSPSLSYFLYLPRELRSSQLLVSVHGISRNAQAHALSFATQAELYGIAVVAPVFSEASFPDYQRLGRRGLRADLALHRIVAEVASLCEASSEGLWLFGYSGGGQFVHRYAMAYPEKVAATAIAAAGWYTFPDPGIRYPRGVGATASLAELDLCPERFLRVPGLVLVGSEDTDRGGDLRTSKRLDRQQGLSRLERGRRWTEAMAAAARDKSYSTCYEFAVLPNCAHSFQQCVTWGGLPGRVAAFLSRSSHGRLEAPRVRADTLTPSSSVGLA